MGWETRGNKRYYYHKTTIGDKNVSLYIGTGRAAELFARQVEGRRIGSAMRRDEERGRRQAERDRLEEEERPVVEFFDQVGAAFLQAMEAAGWYQHRRQWRKRGLITMGKRNQIPSLGLFSNPEFQKTIARRLFADDDGTLADEYGADMARNAENALISQITDDVRQREAFRRKLALMTAELAGSDPTAIVRLLARRVSLCWLDAYYMDMLSALTMRVVDADFSLSEYYQRRQTRAHRRFLSACKALATCRKLAIETVQSSLQAIST